MRHTTVFILLFLLGLSPAAAQEESIIVSVSIDPDADFSVFAMVGSDIVFRSGAADANTGVMVPVAVKGKTIQNICVRLGDGWRVPGPKGKTFQASCFKVEQKMIERGATGYSMKVERGDPSVPMPD